MLIALFVDEIALLKDAQKEEVKRMVEYYGAAGLYPILATNNPVQASILVKGNLSTRICFAVPSFNESTIVLGMKGAETLSQRGRGLILLDNQLIEFQSFTVHYPRHDEEKFRQHIEDLMSRTQPTPAPQKNDIAEMAEQIRAQWSSEMSKSAVSRLFGKNYTGTSWCRKIDQVIEYLRSTTPTQEATDLDLTPAPVGE
jgi:DNA segregation ATPase FtsK/SpoIIIE-like protein